MLTNNKVIIIYTLILSLLSFFTNSLIDDTGQSLDDTNYLKQNNIYSDTLSTIHFNSDSNTINQVSDFLFFILKLPILIFKLLMIIIIFPFTAIDDLPEVVSIILYLPYTIILVFDILIPLLLKLGEVIGEYIPFT